MKKKPFAKISKMWVPITEVYLRLLPASSLRCTKAALWIRALSRFTACTESDEVFWCKIHVREHTVQPCELAAHKQDIGVLVERVSGRGSRRRMYAGKETVRQTEEGQNEAERRQKKGEKEFVTPWGSDQNYRVNKRRLWKVKYIYIYVFMSPLLLLELLFYFIFCYYFKTNM